MGADLVAGGEPILNGRLVHEGPGDLARSLLPLRGLSDQIGNEELYRTKAALLKDWQRVFEHVTEAIIESNEEIGPVRFGGKGDLVVALPGKAFAAKFTHLLREKPWADV